MGTDPAKTAQRRKPRIRADVPAKQSATKAVSLLLVDDHPMWRQTVRRVVEEGGAGTVVAEASDGEEAIRLAEELEPDVILMDIDLPVIDGNEATQRLVRANPKTKVLMLSASDERDDVVAALRAGAFGYLLKTASPADVIEAVRRVRDGELVFPSSVADLVRAEMREPGAAEPPGVSVILADPSPLFRDGVARLLEGAGFDVIGLVGRAEALDPLIEQGGASVVVMDIRLPPLDADGGVAAAVRIKRSAPDVGILLLSQTIDTKAAAALLAESTGGVGYLLKDRVADVAQLGEALRRIAGGGSVIDPDVASRLVRGRKERDPLDELTDREREVLGLMAEGRSNQAISERLYLSPKAIEAHVHNIFMKLGLEPAADDHRRVLAVVAYLRSL